MRANGSGAFLMNALQPDIIIMMVHNELEELEARYLTEKDHRDEKVVFYTSMPRSANLLQLYYTLADKTEQLNILFQRQIDVGNIGFITRFVI